MINLSEGPGWAQMMQLFQELPMRLEKAEHQAVLKEAHFLRAKMIEGIDSGKPGGKAFAPHSPITLAVRKFKGFNGTKIMIVSGGLRASAKVVVLRSGVAFVGLNRKANGKDIAKIHDEGRSWTQPLTPRARRFLMAALRAADMSPGDGGGGGAVRIRIPPRPVVGPTLERWARPKDVRIRFQKNLAAAMGGAIGRP